MAETANERLQSLTIAHATYLERYKRDQVRRIVALLNDELEPAVIAKLEARLERIATRGFDTGMHTTQRLRDLKAAIDLEIATFAATAHKMVKAELLKVAKQEAAWQVSALERVVPAEVAVLARVDFVSPAPETLRAIVNEGPINGALLKDWFKKLEDDTKRAVTKAVNVGLSTGETTAQIVARVRGTKALAYADGVMQGTRAQINAVVSTSVAHTTSQARQQTGEANKDILKGEKWSATLDSSTCFPASTPILTEAGEVPIEALLPGDMVVTHAGRLCPVTDVLVRTYTGRMVTLRFGDTSVTATSDHLFLLGCGVWKEAGDLCAGESVASIGHHFREHGGELTAVFSFEWIGVDADYDVASRAHLSVPAPIALDGHGVPVGTVNLHSDTARKHEVHQIAADLDLGAVLDSEHVQGHADVALRGSFSGAASVATAGTMPADADLSGADAAHLAAGNAGHGMDWPATGFGAMPTKAATVGQETFAAGRAINVPGFGAGTCARAVDVAFGVGPRDGKVLAAGRADLLDLASSSVAGPATESPHSELGAFDGPAAGVAYNAREERWVVGSAHPVALTITETESEYVEGARVFCLRVEEDASFVAGGVVAHNCPRCAVLDGKVFDLGEGPTTPEHVNCRCVRVPVLKSWEDLGIKGPALPTGTRASMDGQVPADLTFGEWLKKQPFHRVHDILGSKAAAASFLSGATPLSAFSTSMGTPLSWKQVKLRA